MQHAITENEGGGGESRFAWKVETHVQQYNYGNYAPLKQEVEVTQSHNL